MWEPIFMLRRLVGVPSSLEFIFRLSGGIMLQEEVLVLENLQIIKLWKECKSYLIISNNLIIPFTTINSFISRYKNPESIEK